MANDWSAVNADNRLQVIQYRFILVKCCLTEVVETTPRLCLAQVNSREMALIAVNFYKDIFLVIENETFLLGKKENI